MSTVKYPRVVGAKQRRPFAAGCISMFPMGTRIDLDKKRAVEKKEHCIIYQQGSHYGQVGDMCTYISHEELFQLQKDGAIEIYSG